MAFDDAALALYLAATLLLAIGIAHSYLGERYILIRLFRRNSLPPLFGDTEFTRRTLRFAWHLLSFCWFGFAACLTYFAQRDSGTAIVLQIISITFFLHFLVTIIASRGRHLSWIVFLAICLLTFYASRS